MHRNQTSLFSALTMALFLALGLSVQAMSEAWMTDFDAAKEKAAQDGKDLLVNFGGSDWCGWCIRLDKEVFSQESFQEGASEDFILVNLDFPRKPENEAKIPEALRKRNDELRDELGVQGYPTVYLMDAKGVPYAQTGYRKGGPEKYLEELEGCQENRDRKNELVAKAANPDIQGLERAKLLHEIIEATPEELAEKLHAADMKEIVKLDSENTAGLKAIYQTKERLAEARAAAGARNFEKSLELFQAILDELKPTGETLQDVLYEKGGIHFRLQDKEGMRTCLEEALKAAPDSENAENIKGTMARFFPADEPATPEPAAAE